MQTASTKKLADLGGLSVNRLSLTLNGYKAIESYTLHEPISGTLFLEENILLFVTEGSVGIRYGKLEYMVNKNQMAFLKKDILVEYQTGYLQQDNTSKNKFIIVSLRYELVKEFAKMAELCLTPKCEVSPVTLNTADQQLLKYIDSLQPYFIQPEKIGCSLIKIKLLELLFYLAGSDKQILEQVLDLKEHFRSNITNTVEENIMNSLSLSQLAVLAGRSLSSFRRDFQAIYNMPPSQWIRKKRLEKAQELLTSTTMTVTDICYTLGFESIAHFSRLFKSQFGYPPSEFRLNILVA
ncbi:AraC family transcriptional regulator [Ferruginibacter paludis]|uniref:helix-turn-helix domain-containing protein n=1 Tax=Ferruginibacter paludis TaxID=1310417 RepID=UPI0025B405D2|nr:AraC family transcriptional regulator [Ferruginibacter paludis]MDN3656102.1 AraC family transcriptional regulator [Ferruginibacter paludis]